MQVLYIDLGEEKVEVKDRVDLFEKYLGGSGVAIKLLLEECPPRVDPLSPENPIILAIGPLSAVFPTCTKVVAMFKSPLTNELGESHAGGRLAAAMRFANYGAIVIKGKASRPVYLSIHDREVKFKDASSIWGISSSYTVGQILRKVEPGVGKRSIIRIGVAGERKVRYANVNVDTYRHFGRLGLGAVFGSKYLKAAVISGSQEIAIANMEKYREVYKEIYDLIVGTDRLKKYHDYGTAININALNELKALPTKNLQSAQFEYADYISGEQLAENYMARHMACVSCPVGCIHIAMLRMPFAEGFEFETKLIPYDYEPIYALGSFLRIPLAEGVLRLIERADHLGLDALTTGVVLGWATEAYENHLISKRDTMNVQLRWGDVESYLKAMGLIVKQPNEFYKTLAEGVIMAAKKYGGEDFAIALGGLEIAGYHTGYANLIGHIVAPRHGHLDNAGYSIDQKAVKQRMTQEQVIDAIICEDNTRAMLNSLVICLFARSVYTEDVVSKALETLGIKKTKEELLEIGKEIFKLKYEFKKREGFNLAEVKIPKRFFETESMQGKLSEEEAHKMLKLYREKLKDIVT
jgi:aldehyde:ferredoxin oxidoreductase